MLHIGPQAVDRPVSRAIGGDARDFRIHMRPPGQIGDPRRPAGKIALGQCRHPAVIQHKGGAGAGVHQIKGQRQLALQHADIKGQPRHAKPRHILAEQWQLRDTVIDHMQHPADSAHRLAVKPVQPGGKPRCLGTGRRNRPAQQAAGLHHLGGHPGRLGIDIGLGDVDFHMQGTRDAQPCGLIGIVRKRPVAVQRGHPGKPGVGQAFAVDQMQMGVEQHGRPPGGGVTGILATGSFPSSRTHRQGDMARSTACPHWLAEGEQKAKGAGKTRHPRVFFRTLLSCAGGAGLDKGVSGKGERHFGRATGPARMPPAADPSVLGPACHT